MGVERRAYTENLAAQEAAYWYCRKHGIRVDDFDIGAILQVAGPHIIAAERARIEGDREKSDRAHHRAHGPLDSAE